MSTPDEDYTELVENIGRLAAALIDTLLASAKTGLDYTHMAFALGLAIKGLGNVAEQAEGIDRAQAMRTITLELARALSLPDHVVQTAPGEGPSQIIPVMKHGKH